MSNPETFLSRLQWRHATKAFDPSRRVASGDLKLILDSVHLAPTSFGLQPFHVHVINDQPTKDRITAVGWNQTQYKTASEILVFTTVPHISPRIDEYFEIASGGNPKAREAMKGYEGMMRNYLEPMTPAALHQWAARQVYIAFGFAMAACAELGIDSCPMEGFSPPDVDKVLNLPEGEKSTVILTVGYRDPSIEVRPKVRLPQARIFPKR